MRRALLFASLAALPAYAQDEPPVGGIGRLACSEITGAANAPYLAQASDWALGYMAGRIDAGQSPAEGETLSPDDSVDVIAGIAIRCRETPDAPVIDAVRAYADRIFDETAEGGPVTADPPAPPPDMPPEPEAPRETDAPPPRPDDLTEAAANDPEGDERPSDEDVDDDAEQSPAEGAGTD
ncbi:hypothetical protein [Palleronia abyssalis]|uniref:Uncharacterized protein n=1 Tax=Palleronia abyssalis TaxID=1501240 RepID=A0A2R8BVV4_9RHOB|nr:hypothetical protein [Palleronia abyssalis]SPJ24298.1 hypothetical protein PAA8504_02126 [Palleronia abyssalis]